MTTWKKSLSDKIPKEIGKEIDVFETQIELMLQGKVEERLFAETRLRCGAYGQRYDNGQRHDGTAPQTLSYPASTHKGPDTLWDAPGMQRIKIPYGGLSAEQMEVLADVAEEASDGVCHVTTRQDIQLHYVHIEDTPDIMRRLAAVGITTREACGNSVRNVTACPLAGVCHDESFDVTPYAKACSRFLLGHPDVQDFGRKLKIAFSGCRQHACALVNIHDLGFIAATQEVDGKMTRGFSVYVGGGLGAVPYEAKLLTAFVTEQELLPLSQAICRIFARYGEKRNRGRARMKFLVDKMGIDEFKSKVFAERALLGEDLEWRRYMDALAVPFEEPSNYGEVSDDEAAAVTSIDQPLPEEEAANAEFARWWSENVYAQRQPGRYVVTVMLPLGDASSWQMRALADISRRFSHDCARTTVEQNVVLRWVLEQDLPMLYRALKKAGLAAVGAGSIVDVTACPGTDTCKLGIASSRGLAAEIRERLASRAYIEDQAIRGLHIKISGCFNSCSQHHLADLGFYGVGRKVAGATVPHFRVVLGGQWDNNAASYGQACGAVPSKRIPVFIDDLMQHYITHRNRDESFRQYVVRVGKKTLRSIIDLHAKVPEYQEDASYYSDWRDPREFSISDIGTGECAGEVISRVDFDLQAAEREYFEAQTHFDADEYRQADETAYQAMLTAAQGLVRSQFLDISNIPEKIVQEFKERFVESGAFADRYAGNKFAQFLFQRHNDASERKFTRDQARHLLEETQLFIEASHACYGRVQEKNAARPKVSSP